MEKVDCSMRCSRGIEGRLEVGVGRPILLVETNALGGSDLSDQELVALTGVNNGALS